MCIKQNNMLEFSLNEFHVNSANHNKILKWYGYQRYHLSDNKYITCASNRKCSFPITTLIRYILLLTTLNRYHSRDGNGNFFLSLYLKMSLLSDM